MSFGLSIVIGGMNLLVADEDAGVVHLIAAGVNHHPHTTRIFGGGSSWSHTLDNGLLDLSDLASDAGVAPPIPDTVMQLEHIASSPLKLQRKFLDDKPRDIKVTAHIKLSGGALTACTSRCFKPTPRSAERLAACAIVWSADVDQIRLPALPIAALRGGTMRLTTPLNPSNGRIRLGLASVTPDVFADLTDPDLLCHPRTPYKPDHFDAFLRYWIGKKGAPVPCSSIGFRTFPRICPTIQVSTV